MNLRGFEIFLKIDNSVILQLYESLNHKRALLIYAYILHIGKNSRAIATSPSVLIELFNLKVGTRSKGSIKDALNILLELGLISIHSDKRLLSDYDLDKCIKEPKGVLWVSVTESTADNFYTLIPVSTIEDVIFSNVPEKPEDMFAVLSYICSKTERRENVSPVMWVGMNNMAKDIHMSESKMKMVLASRMELDVAYFKRADLSAGRKNYIYGLYRDKDFVDDAVLIAQSNNNVDKRIKSIEVSGGVIEVIDGEYAIDMHLSKFFDRHEIECNEGITDETNKFYRKHGRKRLMEVLGEHNIEIHNADNKNGAYRSLLRRTI